MESHDRLQTSLSRPRFVSYLPLVVLVSRAVSKRELQEALMARSSDTLLGALDLLVLKTLARGPNHGFGIALHIQTVSEGLLRVEEGSLYPALHRLERDKFVKASWTQTENGRRARIYKLTASGRQRLEEAESNWDNVSKGVTRILRFV